MKSCPLWVHRFAVTTAGLTLVLLCAGALVTGTGSGLAVPDWPLSYGQFFPPMIGGVLFEHGHRMVAGTVGILMMLLAASVWITEPRRWVKYLALLGVLAVVSQATLGGLTVLFRLPKPISIAHACLGQLFFSITVVLAFVTSPSWDAPSDALEDEGLPGFALFVAVGFFCQLLIGATMRHMHAGLAIPDFPTSFGGWAPTEWPLPVAVHYAHRVGALTMLVLTSALVIRVYRRSESQLGLVALAGMLAAFVAVQLMMGAMVIWMQRPVFMTTAHLAVGACCLATSIAIAARAFRLRQGVLSPRPYLGPLFTTRPEPA